MNPPDLAAPPPPKLRIPVTRPLWVNVCLAINVGLWLLMALAGGSENPEVLIRFGASFSPLIVQGELWRLFTANFLHIGVVHLVFNSLALYSL